MARTSSLSPIYQLKITLRGSRPPIWRRVLVPGDATLAKLHHIVQDAMGWYDCHLHEFIVGGISYGVPDPEYGGEVKSERRMTLGRLAGAPKAKLRYVYDFGDDWEHDILVEKLLPPEPGATYPRCIAGKRACPPEDCGGIWGYANFLEAIQDPAHPEHDELLEWIGGSFDPEAFNLDAVNQALRRVR